MREAFALSPSLSPSTPPAARAITFFAAASLVDEGVGTREDTDLGARVGLRWSAGPFALMNRRGTAQALELVSDLAQPRLVEKV